MPIFSKQQAEVLAAIFRLTKSDPDAVATLDEIKEETGIDKPNLSKIISTMRTFDDEDRNKYVRTSRARDKKGYQLNFKFLVTSSLTAHIFLELKRKSARNSIPLDEFRKQVMDSDYYKKAIAKDRADNGTFDERIGWGLNPSVAYLEEMSETTEKKVIASQRVHDEGFYLELIELKDS